ncbi:MAG: SRPBCC family protein [Candidatus Magasanikbacteria bacterium]|nr:SRPBCC family protein [Candidatus Magasanikbacteria bacterium]
MSEKITVETSIDAPIEKIWKYWNEPEHIKNWCNASSDWWVPTASNDLQVGGKFNTRMEASDGSFGFDFGGVYTIVTPYEEIEYNMSDGRNVSIKFIKVDNGYKIIESFDPENQNPPEMQKNGWQSILENFKKYITEQK